MRRHRRLVGVAVVFVHGVNPWGFAWLRRVNEDNVDINRNFLDHGGGHPPNPDYAKLGDLLNPRQLDAGGDAAFLEVAARFEREQGQEAVYRSLSGGQYDYPTGVQFGGRRAVWSNDVLRDVWQRHAGKAAIAASVDCIPASVPAASACSSRPQRRRARTRSCHSAGGRTCYASSPIRAGTRRW